MFDFVGMSVELASLHHQEYDFSRINVRKNKETGPSLEMSADPVVSLETMTEPKLVDNGASIETVGDHVVERVEVLEVTGEREQSRMGENNEQLSMYDNDMIDPHVNPVLSVNGLEGLEVTGEREQSQMGGNNEHLSVNDDEMIEPRENPVSSKNRLEEVHCTTTEVYASQEQIKDPESVLQEVCADAAELGISSLNADVDPTALAGKVSIEPIENEAGDTANVSDGLVHIASLDETGELETADVNDGQLTGRDVVSEKDGDVNGECETENGTRDTLVNMDLNGDAIELGANIEHALNEIYTAPAEEEHMQASLQEDGFLRNGEDDIYPEAFQPNMMGAEISGFDLHERDVSSLISAVFFLS